MFPAPMHCVLCSIDPSVAPFKSSLLSVGAHSGLIRPVIPI